MNNKKKLSVPINFRVDDELSTGITTLADRLKLSESQLIRNVLTQLVFSGNARGIEKQIKKLPHTSALVK